MPSGTEFCRVSLLSPTHRAVWERYYARRWVNGELASTPAYPDAPSAGEAFVEIIEYVQEYHRGALDHSYGEFSDWGWIDTAIYPFPAPIEFAPTRRRPRHFNIGNNQAESVYTDPFSGSQSIVTVAPTVGWRAIPYTTLSTYGVHEWNGTEWVPTEHPKSDLPDELVLTGKTLQGDYIGDWIRAAAAADMADALYLALADDQGGSPNGASPVSVTLNEWFGQTGTTTYSSASAAWAALSISSGPIGTFYPIIIYPDEAYSAIGAQWGSGDVVAYSASGRSSQGAFGLGAGNAGVLQEAPFAGSMLLWTKAYPPIDSDSSADPANYPGTLDTSTLGFSSTDSWSLGKSHAFDAGDLVYDTWGIGGIPPRPSDPSANIDNQISARTRGFGLLERRLIVDFSADFTVPS